jgi:hypothetical protein
MNHATHRNADHPPGWAAALLLFAFSLALYTLNDSWAYTHNLVDEWVMTGNILDWHDYAREFPFNYRGARVSWLAPAWPFLHFLPAFWANLSLRALLLAGGAAPVLLTLRRLGASLAGATLGALLLISNPYFLQAAGWNYVNGPGLDYVAWSLFFLSAAARARKRSWWLLAAGAAMLSAVWCYLMVAFLGGAFAVFYLVQRGWPRLAEATREIAWLIAGGEAITIVLGLINMAMGGPFLFFVPQFGEALRIAEEPSLSAPLALWLSNASWLIVPGLGVVAGVLLALPSTGRRWGLDRRVVATGLALIVAAVSLGLLDVTNTRVALEYNAGIHAVYLLPFAILPLALLIDHHLTGRTTFWQAGAVLAVAAVLLVFYYAPLAIYLRKVKIPWVRPSSSLLGNEHVFIVFAFVVGVLVIALIASVSRPNAISLTALALGLSYLNVVTAPGTNWIFPAQAQSRDRFLLTLDALAALSSLNQDHQLYLWFRNDDRHNNIAGDYLDVAGPFFWRERVSNRYPSFIYDPTPHKAWQRRDILPALKAGSRLALLGDPSELPTAASTMAGRGLTLHIVQQRILREGQAAVPLTVLVVAPANSKPGAAAH